MDDALGMHVSQKLIIKDQSGRILALMKSGTDSTRPHTWDLPGGQVEEGENLEASARREVMEETRLEISKPRFVHADARVARDGRYWVVLFSTAESVGTDIKLSDEHEAYEWLDRKEFAARESSDRIRELLLSSIAL